MTRVMLPLIVVLFVSSHAMAESMGPLPVEADAKIRGGDNGDTAYGWQDSLTVMTYGTNLTNCYKAYMRFDISSITSAVETATFQIKQKGASSSWNNGNPKEVKVFGLNDGVVGETTWDESTITWNNAPGNDTAALDGFVDATYLGYFTHVGTWEGWRPFGSESTPSFDALASFINADTNGTITLMLAQDTEAPDNDNIYSVFHSRESGNVPALYYTPVPEPASCLYVTMAAWLLLVRRRVA